MNIIEPLLQHAHLQPNKCALIHQHEHRTYKQLVCAMKQVAKPTPVFSTDDVDNFFEKVKEC